MADGVLGAESSFHTYKPQHTSAAWGGACLRLRSADNNLKLPLYTNNFYRTPKHLPLPSATNMKAEQQIGHKNPTHCCWNGCLFLSLSQLCRLCVLTVLEEKGHGCYRRIKQRREFVSTLMKRREDGDTKHQIHPHTKINQLCPHPHTHADTLNTDTGSRVCVCDGLHLQFGYTICFTIYIKF